MAHKIEMTEDRLLLKKRIEKKGEGGIELPPDGSINSTDYFAGEVIVAGDGCKKIKQGDTVLYKEGYSKLSFEGTEYHVVREGSVVARINDHA